MKRNLLVALIFVALGFLSLSVEAQPKQRSEKRGVAEEQFAYPAEIHALSPGVCWTYNWGTGPNNNLKEYLGPGKEMEFIPMAWNIGSSKDAIRAYYKANPDSKYLLGYNEPNLADQSNITPAQAVEDWPNLEAIANEFNLKLVSPAMSYTGSAINDGKVWQPFDWMDEFLKLFKEKYGREPKMDYIAIHTYMNGADPTLGFVQQWIDRYGKQIWVTEFAAGENNPDSLTQVRGMIKKVEGLERNPGVFRYAWFKATSGSRWVDRSPYWRLLIKPNLRTHKPAAGTMTGQGVVYTYMSTFDDTYYYKPGETVMAKDYVSSNGIGLEVSVDTLPTSKNTHLAVEFGNSNSADYLINVPTAGTYTFTFRYSDRSSATRAQVLDLSVDGSSVGTVRLAPTGTYRSSDDVYAITSTQINLPAGKHRLTFSGTQPINHARVTWFSFTSTTGISNISATGEGLIKCTLYYTLQGALTTEPRQGVFIEKTVYTDGHVITRKVMRK